MAGMVSLSRVDYMQVNPCEHRGTLKLLPFGGHKRQRVVIGDDAGALVCFGIKKFETKMHFTAPLDTGAGVSDVYITRGSNGDAAGRIFSSSGTSVAGVNKKGKVYFSFKSNMSEGIENLHVENRHIWATGEYVFCSFDENGRELHYYMCPDRINHMLMLQDNNAGNFALLGCQDSTVRIVEGDRLELDVAVSGAVRSVAELHAVPFRARTAKEEDPEFSRRGSLLGRFSRKGKDKKKSKKKGKDKFEDSNKKGGEGAGKGGEDDHADGGEGKDSADNTSKFESPGGAASVGVSSAAASDPSERAQGGGEGKRSGDAGHASGGSSSNTLKTSFVYGTTTGGVGAISVEGGVGQRSWFVQPPVSGEAR
jgi:hypothetical protein